MIKHKANKNLGQNFLIDQNIAKKIVYAIDIKDKNVLEIGPGKGVLTKHIVELNSNLVCVELDSNLANYLKNEFETNSKVKINQIDILDFDLSKAFDNDYIVISNLPYYISSKIIFMVAKENKVTDAIFMLQKEVGDKIVAKHTSSLYGRISASVQALFEVSKVANVSKNAFMPKPQVDSVVIHLKRKQIDFDFAGYEEFIKQAFASRRKMLINNIDKIHHSKLGPEILKKRAEDFSVDELINIYKKIAV